MSGLTLGSAGIGVWEGARVIYIPPHGYQCSLRTPGECAIVSEVEYRGDAAWALTCFGEETEAHPVACLALDLTHRPTRLEVMARLGGMVWPDIGCDALAGLDPDDDTRLADGARVVDVQALAIVAARAFAVTS